jgi:hypothetical protein
VIRATRAWIPWGSASAPAGISLPCKGENSGYDLCGPAADAGRVVTVWQTVLVFVVAPVGGMLLLALLVIGPAVSRAPRYRPGRSWEHEPVWYVARPAATATGPTADPGRLALTSANRRALPGRGSAPASVLDAPVGSARGGANGQW